MDGMITASVVLNGTALFAVFGTPHLPLPTDSVTPGPWTGDYPIPPERGSLYAVYRCTAGRPPTMHESDERWMGRASIVDTGPASLSWHVATQLMRLVCTAHTHLTNVPVSRPAEPAQREDIAA